MLKGLFDMDNPFWRFMSLVADLIILNLLFVLCSIPIITIGASTTALYTVTLKLAKNQDGYIASTFFKAFKDNFKQSTIIWLIMIGIGILLGADIMIINALKVPGELILNYILLFVILIFVMTLCYVFPLQSKFVNPVKQTMKNALVLSIGHFPRTILIILIHAIPIVLLWLDVVNSMVLMLAYVFPFMSIIGFGLIAYLSSKIFHKIFKKYIPEDPLDEFEMISDNYITEVLNKEHEDEENTLPQ